MTNRQILPFLFVAAIAFAGGCSIVRKPAKPTENPSIAGQTEESLKTRWIDRRVAELVAQGTAAEAARAQAAEEFRVKFPYMGTAQK
jgi:hypothetical protein